VTVTFAGQTKSTQADADGKWTVKLDPVMAQCAAANHCHRRHQQKRKSRDVLVGESVDVLRPIEHGLHAQ